jgi:hypothetical protein
MVNLVPYVAVYREILALIVVNLHSYCIYIFAYAKQ